MQSSARRTWSVSSAIVAAQVLALMVSGCGASEPPAGSIDSVMVHIERQVGFGPRIPGSPAHDRAVRYLARTLERYGARVSLQSFEVDDPYGVKPLRLINIIGSFAPERKRRLMLCAHYDSRPWADQDADSSAWSTPVPGAVDGAASVAVLMEIARVVGIQPPGDIGVDVVFFDGEDYGKSGDLEQFLLGSMHFAVNLGGYRPEYAILIDMVGGKGTRVQREGFSNEHAARWLDYVFARAEALGLDYFESTAGRPMYDDHVPLLRAGIPCVDLFGYDYGAWHTLHDDMSQVDPEKLGQVVTLLRDIVYNPAWPQE